MGAVGASVSVVEPLPPPEMLSGQVFCADGPPQITVAKYGLSINGFLLCWILYTTLFLFLSKSDTGSSTFHLRSISGKSEE